MRGIPIFTFINKLDRDANDTFELLDEIEKELGIETVPMNWPLGSGKSFRGVYERESKEVILYSDTEKGTKEGHAERISVEDGAKLTEAATAFDYHAFKEEQYDKLAEHVRKYVDIPRLYQILQDHD